MQMIQMDTEYLAQNLQCTREGKQECLMTVRLLAELAFAAKQFGMLKMDEMIQDEVRFPNAFLRKAVGLALDISDEDKIRKILYNYILSSKHIANYQFLSEIIITETVCALCASENLDYIFTCLIPSYFGIEYETMVVDVYRNYKQSLLNGENS